MRTLLQTLRDYDNGLVTIIANRWDVDLVQDDLREPADQLAEAMLNPEAAVYEWSRLNDKERGALQVLLSAKQFRMPQNHFARLYGDIRVMGEDRRQREKPHLQPTGIGETLYYRGLISLGFDQGKVGAQSFVYVPTDLGAILPIHQTGFDLSLEEDEFPDDDPTNTPGPALAQTPVAPPAIELVDTGILAYLRVDPPADTLPANAYLVDDMTTLLAYLQTRRVALNEGYVSKKDETALFQNFIGMKRPTRLGLLLKLAYEMGLVEQQDEHLVPERTAAKQWLEAQRTVQLQALIAAWDESFLFNELWYVPSLRPDEAGWENDPTLLRQTLQEFFAVLPGREWISLTGLIDEIKRTDPDFQRPGGDYNSWYIRSANTGAYLNGFETWDEVEGATLRLAILGPLYWLGLINLGRASKETPLLNAHAFQLTAHGRAWSGHHDWLQASDPPEKIMMRQDGTLWVGRHVSRYDRFQLARFADWLPLPDEITYAYQLSASSLQRAAREGIEPRHIDTFLRRASGQDLPQSIQQVLGNVAQTAPSVSGEATVSLHHLMVLEVTHPDQLQQMWADPTIRRFLSRRLSDTAVVVRAEQVQDLLQTLNALGIFVENFLER